MRSTIKWRRNGLMALVAGAAAALALPALGNTVLKIDFDYNAAGDDRICLNCDDAANGLFQALTGSPNKNDGTGCELITDPTQGSPKSLINFSATGDDTPSFSPNVNFIGVKNLDGGADCGRVSGSLGGTLTLQFGEPITGVLNKALLPFVVQNKAEIQITTTGPEGVKHYVVLGKSGKVSRDFPKSGTLLDGTFPCDGTCVIELPGGWRTIDMKSPGGESAASWSLGGTDAEFFFVDGVLACGETVPIADGAVSLTRLPNMCENEASDVCPVKIPYSVSYDGTTLDFFADYSQLATCKFDEFDDPVTEEPAFEWTVNWDAARLPVGSEDFPLLDGQQQLTTLANRVPLSQQYFLPSDPVFNVDACIGEFEYIPVYDDIGPVEDAEGQPILGLVLKLFEPVARYDMSSLDGIQYGCFLERTVAIVESTSCADITPGEEAICVQKTERVYVRGDWAMTSNWR